MKHQNPTQSPASSSVSMLQRVLLATIGAALLVAASAQAGQGPQPSGICNRACWGARSPQCTVSQMSALTRGIIHHTANANDWNTAGLDATKIKIREHQNFHMDSNGWCDLGYHFMLDKHGNIFEGRSGSMSSLPRGSHDGNNGDSFGFTWMGYFHSPYNHTPTTVMRNRLYDVVAWKMPSAWSPYGSGSYNGNTVGFLDGHRKVKATACPGDIAHNNYIGSSYTGGEARNAVNARKNPPTTAIVVDNSNAGFTASATWATGTSSTDKNGADYRWRSTEAISDPAQWTANLGATRSYNVSAWWAQGSNRSTSAAYHVDHAAGTTVVNANQQANGGKWNSLGSWNMNAGSNKVQLSCWAATGFIVVADAIRWQ